MMVYLLYSNWMHNGDNAVNEVIGVYDCLRKAQNALCHRIYNDLEYYSYENMSGDGSFPICDMDIPELSRLFYSDPKFVFDFVSVHLWNGECKEYSEDYQFYEIEERNIL